MTAIDVTAAYASAFHRYGSPRMKAPTAANQIELVGVRVRLLTLCQKFDAGRAPSRENAALIRDVAVTDDMPQKNWAPMTISIRSLAAVVPIASMKIWAGGTAAAASVP